MTYYHVCCISAYVCLHAAGVCLKTSCKLTDLLRAGHWLQTRAAFQYLPNDVTHLFVEYHWASQSSPSFFFFSSSFLGARSDHIWTGGWSLGGCPDWIRPRALLHAVVATCESRSSHALQLYHLYRSKWDFNLLNEHLVALNNTSNHKLIRKTVY